MKNLIVLGLVIFIAFSVPNLEFLPWWGFTVFLFGLGVWVNSVLKWKISSFKIGFIGGFVVWFCLQFGFSYFFYNGIILYKLAELYNVNAGIILLATGVLGGLLCGLSILSGYRLLKDVKGYD